MKRILAIVILTMAAPSLIFSQTAAQQAAPGNKAAATTAQQQATATQSVQPAAQNRLFVIIEERVKPEMWDEYLAFLKNEAIPAQIRGGLKERQFWTVQYGGEGMTILWSQPIENLAALENVHIFPGIKPEESKPLRDKRHRCLVSARRFLLRSLPELSHVKTPADIPATHALLARRSIAPFRTDEFQNFIKTVDLPFWQQQNTRSHLVYATLLSGDNNEYIEIVPFNGYADLRADPLPPQQAQLRTLERAHKMPPGVLLRTEQMMLQYRPELSIAGGKVAGQAK